MKVLKFGGTSVGSAERMQNVVRLISDGEPKIVVLSAMSGTTNSLIEFTNYLRNGNVNGACEHSTFLQTKYMQTIKDLYKSEEAIKSATDKVNEILITCANLQQNHYAMTLRRRL